jgi:hypothetical protein
VPPPATPAVHIPVPPSTSAIEATPKGINVEQEAEPKLREPASAVKTDEVIDGSGKENPLANSGERPPRPSPQPASANEDPMAEFEDISGNPDPIAFCDVINIFEVNPPDEALRRVKDKYGAEVTYNHEIGLFDKVWMHDYAGPQGGNKRSYIFCHLFHNSINERELHFVWGRIGDVTHWKIILPEWDPPKIDNLDSSTTEWYHSGFYTVKCIWNADMNEWYCEYYLFGEKIFDKVVWVSNSPCSMPERELIRSIIFWKENRDAIESTTEEQALASMVQMRALNKEDAEIRAALAHARFKNFESTTIPDTQDEIEATAMYCRALGDWPVLIRGLRSIPGRVVVEYYCAEDGPAPAIIATDKVTPFFDVTVEEAQKRYELVMEKRQVSFSPEWPPVTDYGRMMQPQYDERLATQPKTNPPEIKHRPIEVPTIDAANVDADWQLVELEENGNQNRINPVPTDLNLCGMCFKPIELKQGYLEGQTSKQKYHMECDPRKAKEKPPDLAKCGVCGEDITGLQNPPENENRPEGDPLSSSDPDLKVRNTGRYIRDRKRPSSDFIEGSFMTRTKGTHRIILGALKNEAHRTEDGRLVLTTQSILHPLSEERMLESPLTEK